MIDEITGTNTLAFLTEETSQLVVQSRCRKSATVSEDRIFQ